jgi:DNA replication and repair protein RecF
VQIKSLSVCNFRNLRSGNYCFGPGVNVFIGANGQGKTSLIEACIIAAAGRSFRTSRLSEAITFGSKLATVRVSFNDAIGLRCVGTTWGHRSSRLVEVDGKEEVKASSVVGLLPFVLFTPSDSDLVKGSSLARRNLLDKHIVDVEPRIIDSVVRYRRAVRQKLSLLKSGNANSINILPWNLVLAREGAIIWRVKRKILRGICERTSLMYKILAPSEENLEVKIVSQLASDILDSEIEAFFQNKLQEGVLKEISTGRVLIGPHRDDLNFLLDSHDMRVFASQGQLRTAALALKLASVGQIEQARGEPPLVFLDDVLSELDLFRVRALGAQLIASSCQVFVTTTDLSYSSFDVPTKGNVFYEIISGTINPSSIN